jgi:sarcosine oxidase subunit beta
MQKFSIWSLLRNSVSYHEGWQRQWRSPELKREYEVVVVGAGGHGLATAYYLATEHGLRNVAVVERGWSGGQHCATPPSCARTTCG